jgi:hypothetical protein
MNANILHISESTAAVVSVFGVLGAFGGPILIVGFLFLAVLAPTRPPRMFLLASAGLEVLGELCVLLMLCVFPEILFVGKTSLLPLGKGLGTALSATQSKWVRSHG